MESENENPATWKFKWYEALTIGVKPKDLPVAQILLQHCNGPDGLVNPSQALIAHYLGCHVRKVERTITDLVEAGVIERVRWSRNASNRYRFVADWRQRQIEKKSNLRHEWQDLRRTDPTELWGAEQEGCSASDGSNPQ